MTTVATFRYKQGATFSETFGLRDFNRSVIQLDGWTGACQLRYANDALLATLAVTFDTVEDSFTIYADETETELWPVGTYTGDIKLAFDGDVKITSSFTVAISRPATRVAV